MRQLPKSALAGFLLVGLPLFMIFGLMSLQPFLKLIQKPEIAGDYVPFLVAPVAIILFFVLTFYYLYLLNKPEIDFAELRPKILIATAIQVFITVVWVVGGQRFWLFMFIFTFLGFTPPLVNLPRRSSSHGSGSDGDSAIRN